MIESVEHYRKFLHPLIYAMLETGTASGMGEPHRVKAGDEHEPAALTNHGKAAKPISVRS